MDNTQHKTMICVIVNHFLYFHRGAKFFLASSNMLQELKGGDYEAAAGHANITATILQKRCCSSSLSVSNE